MNQSLESERKRRGHHIKVLAHVLPNKTPVKKTVEPFTVYRHCNLPEPAPSAFQLDMNAARRAIPNAHNRRKLSGELDHEKQTSMPHSMTQRLFKTITNEHDTLNGARVMSRAMDMPGMISQIKKRTTNLVAKHANSDNDMDVNKFHR